MRPRINAFGKITHNELKKHFTDNYVWGDIVKIKEATLVYTYKMMFRNNKEKPEIIHVIVSQTSKLVITAWTNKQKFFKDANELIEYTIKR